MKTLLLPLALSMLLPLTMQMASADDSALKGEEEQQVVQAEESITISKGGIEISVDQDTVDAAKENYSPFNESFGKEMGVEVVIPIFGIVFTFGTPIAIIWIVAAYGARRRRLMHETIAKIVDSGQPIPQELFEDVKPNNGSNSARHKGLVLTFLGFALAIMLTSLADSNVATVALIPMFMGLAYLCSWKLSQNDKKPGSVE